VANSEFQHLYDRRELALLNLVGVVQHAIGNLNLNDPPAALRTLMRGLEVYTLADEAIGEFHDSRIQKKENQSDGNRSAAA